MADSNESWKNEEEDEEELDETVCDHVEILIQC
jgi:hypothetical protein